MKVLIAVSYYRVLSIFPQILLQQEDPPQDQREEVHLQVQLQQTRARQLPLHRHGLWYVHTSRAERASFTVKPKQKSPLTGAARCKEQMYRVCV